MTDLSLTCKATNVLLKVEQQNVLQENKKLKEKNKKLGDVLKKFVWEGLFEEEFSLVLCNDDFMSCDCESCNDKKNDSTENCEHFEMLSKHCKMYDVLQPFYVPIGDKPVIGKLFIYDRLGFTDIKTDKDSWIGKLKDLSFEEQIPVYKMLHAMLFNVSLTKETFCEWFVYNDIPLWELEDT